MQNIKYITVFTAALLVFGMTAACSNSANNNTSVNKTNSNQTETVKSPEKVETVKTPEPQAKTETVGGTPSAVYKAAYAYRKNKDVAGLKTIMSKDVLEFMTEMGKMDKKSLDEMLKEMTEEPQAKTDDARNEKITGDTAILEYLDDKGAWKTMDFIKEDGQWKMTIPKRPGK